MPSQILIIDDEKSFVRSLTFALNQAGFHSQCAYSGEAGLAAMEDSLPDLVLLDLRLPEMSGMDVLFEAARLYPELPVVMISAHGDTRAAVQAVKAGATDYLTKPFALDELLHLIRNITERTRMQEEITYHRTRGATSSGLVGSSAAMAHLWQTVQRVAGSSAGRILLLGESGTGKAVVARAIHEQSVRSAGAFVEINCAALPEQLIEVELFGAEKGAYTGAHQKRAGLVALAHRGTLFLDEIGELPLALQAKFLHFLENGDYRPVGGGSNHTADVRVIGATNRSLEEEVRLGHFRDDLYFRLNVIEMTVPPLRERDDDLRELLDAFIDSQAREEGCRPITIPQETQELLLAYSWPGNVRELRNLVERLTILHPGQLIRRQHLPAEFHAVGESRGNDPTSTAASLDQHLQRAERQLVLEALEKAGGRKGRAAEQLGLSRHAFKRRLQRLGIT
ncbi:sigma-54-dependent transcriptional regulator [Marinobacter caseinilyticus]|uniref:sigma-54-dependent transcriptional regulator n=1 Tax=Marinobacter caseinilyticus TaxID=2692195 RepID=UPI001F3961F8|nr:sigma-54 dependent transcriptional regulator [Marinobacter caseinilyticus]